MRSARNGVEGFRVAWKVHYKMTSDGWRHSLVEAAKEGARAYWHEHRLRVAGLALAQRCRCDQNWTLDGLQQWAYAFKAIACVLLGREDHTLYASFDAVIVAEYDWSGPHSTMDTMSGVYDWTGLAVPWGWKRWCYDTYRDSSA